MIEKKFKAERSELLELLRKSGKEFLKETLEELKRELEIQKEKRSRIVKKIMERGFALPTEEEELRKLKRNINEIERKIQEIEEKLKEAGGKGKRKCLRWDGETLEIKWGEKCVEIGKIPFEGSAMETGVENLKGVAYLNGFVVYDEEKDEFLFYKGRLEVESIKRGIEIEELMREIGLKQNGLFKSIKDSLKARWNWWKVIGILLLVINLLDVIPMMIRILPFLVTVGGILIIIWLLREKK